VHLRAPPPAIAKPSPWQFISEGPLLFGRTKGATLGEIMGATEWQAHSIRGFISTAGKKHGVKIESSKNEAGERVYRITK
jgi:hypothetical protein